MTSKFYIRARNLSPNESLDSYGIHPNEIIETEDVSVYNPDGKVQDLLKVWYIDERNTDAKTDG